MGRPATRAAAAWHGAGLGTRLPMRGVRTRVRELRNRTGNAKAAAAARTPGAAQTGRRHPCPAGTGGNSVRMPRVWRAAPSTVPQPGVPPAFRTDSSRARKKRQAGRPVLIRSAYPAAADRGQATARPGLAARHVVGRCVCDKAGGAVACWHRMVLNSVRSYRIVRDYPAKTGVKSSQSGNSSR
jgi:hypothetical protein